jgi:beta-glucanase (GH16 family)
MHFLYSSARLSSTSYMLYGKFRTSVKTSGAVGVVTAFISFSDVKDEIDWEITAENLKPTTAQTNVFYKGNIDYTKSVSFIAGNVPLSQTYTELEVDWQPDMLTWYINKKPVRSLKRSTLEFYFHFIIIIFFTLHNS